MLAAAALWGVIAAANAGAGAPWNAGPCADDAALHAALPEQDERTILLRGGGAGALAQAAGKLWLYDGCQLRTLPPAPAEVTPAAGWVFSPNHVWLSASRKAGDNGGLLLRFDGRAWKPVDMPGLGKLPGPPVLWASAPDDIWIGSRKTDDVELYRWDGHRVTRVAFGLGEKLSRGVSVIGGRGPADVWVAPDDSGWILHGDGKRWVKITTEVAFHPASFWSPRPGETWAAGAANTGRPNVWRWDGARLQGVAVLPDAANSMMGAGQRLFAALRNGQIVAPDRTPAGAWSPVLAFRNGALGPAREPLVHRPPSAWASLGELHLESENRAFAFAVRNHTLLAVHGDGRTWTVSGKLPDEVASTVLVSGSTLWATTTTVLAGGGRPASRLLRWDGARFVPVGASAQPLLEMAPAPNEGVWAVGAAGSALRCAVNSCQSIPTGTDETLVGAWILGGGVRAVGAGGTVVESDGRVFRTVAPPRGWELKSAWGRERDCVWAVGPEMLKLGARGWNTPGDLEAIDAAGPLKPVSIGGAGCDDIWVFIHRDRDQGGEMLVQWNGKDWVRTGAPAGLGWQARLVADGTSLWLAGGEGRLWRRGAKGWDLVPTGTKETIWSVASHRGDTWIARGESPVPVRLPPPSHKGTFDRLP